MIEAVLGVAALCVAALSLYSGFGLGTLLLPLFAAVYPPPVAVAATAVVHLFNNLTKLVIVGRHANRGVLLRFVLPAIPAAFVGAWLLDVAADQGALATWSAFGRTFDVTPVGLGVGALITLFAAIELLPVKTKAEIHPRWLPLGGAISGFFGGVSGHQGALRSLFLLRAGLTKLAYVGTAAWAAALVDVTRLAVYGTGNPGAWARAAEGVSARPLIVAMVAAFVGTVLGARLLGKVTLDGLHRLVGVLLVLAGLAMALGLTAK